MSIDAEPAQDELNQLVERARGHGLQAEAAFAELYLRFARNVLAFVTSQRRGAKEPEDLASETWLKVKEKLHLFQGGNFQAWLITIARNIVLDDGRSKARAPHQSSLDSAPEPSIRAIEEDEWLGALRECLQELESEFVMTIRLKSKGLTTAEIASQTGVNENTVYTRVSRGRDELGDCIRRKVG